jgi:predicted dehydrogenase
MCEIGIIGYGYWGKILHKTLNQNVKIYDPIISENRIQNLDNCKRIFIATPVRLHSYYCMQFLNKGMDVFCEKPLTDNVKQSKQLFDIANQNNAYLFVDWTFTYNQHIWYIKDFIENGSIGKLKSISMNRLNLGPIRADVSAKVDLAVHDLSIIYYLLNPKNITIKWIDYKRNKSSLQCDSCIGLLETKDVFIQISCSWHYGQKDRMCIFEFENGFLTWNDLTKNIIVNGQNVNIIGKTPLQNSINAFLNKDTPQEYIKDITLFVEGLL